jgi:myo-inositol-1(or 4)-monophosphatase
MIEAAKQAALAAAEILIRHFKKLPEEAVRKKLKNDFLSFVDESSEKTIIDILLKHYPDHSILAEEGGVQKADSEYRWIIDPLDGTTNYIAGLPIFCISIALQKNEEIILGLIYDPIHDEMFHAEKGKGTFLNDSPIHVSSKASLSESFIATGFPFKAKHFLSDYQKIFAGLFKECIGIRRMGSAAIDLAYLAAGRFDGFWEIGLNPWDVAAGSLIVQEAGGKVTDFWGSNNFINNNYLLASNNLIHKEMEKIIREVIPRYRIVYNK